MHFLGTKSERRSSLAEWQLLGKQAPAFCFLLTSDLEGLTVLPPPLHPSHSPPPSPQHTLSITAVNPLQPAPLSLCLHSTLCCGSYRCCWNINSNTTLIINPARFITLPGQHKRTGLCLNQETPQGPPSRCSPILVSQSGSW